MMMKRQPGEDEHSRCKDPEVGMGLLSLRGRGSDQISKGNRNRSCKNLEDKAICILRFILFSQLFDVLNLCPFKAMEGFKQKEDITGLTFWRDGLDI